MSDTDTPNHPASRPRQDNEEIQRIVDERIARLVEREEYIKAHPELYPPPPEPPRRTLRQKLSLWLKDLKEDL